MISRYSIVLNFLLFSMSVYPIITRLEAHKKMLQEYTVEKEGLTEIVDRLLEAQQFIKERLRLQSTFNLPDNFTIGKEDSQKLVNALQDLKDKKIKEVPKFKSALTEEIFSIVYTTSNDLQQTGFRPKSLGKWKPEVTSFIDEAIGIIKIFTPLKTVIHTKPTTPTTKKPSPVRRILR